MSLKSEQVAFFDVISTLAAVQLSPDGHIQELTEFPQVIDTLEELRGRGVRLGLLWQGCTTENGFLRDAFGSTALALYFDDDLIVPPTTHSGIMFEYAAAAARVNAPHTRTLLVSGSSHTRVQARLAGLLTTPHPVLAPGALLHGSPLRYVRIGVPSRHGGADWAATLARWAVVPLHVSVDPAGGVQVYAIADLVTAAELDALGFWVDRLGGEDEPQTTDLYLVGDREEVRLAFPQDYAEEAHCVPHPDALSRILASTRDGLFVSIPVGRSVGSYCFQGAQHDVGSKLLPSVALLRRFESPRAGWDSERSKAKPFSPGLSDDEKRTLDKYISPEGMNGYVRRYSGVERVAGTTRIRSRNLFHEDNKVAVSEMVRDFDCICISLTAGTVPFPHEGGTFNNVVARLPAQKRNGIIIISAHLDSTGDRADHYYKPFSDAAGADDDGSGVAGVFCAAAALVELSTKYPELDRHEIRFVLFNGEEEGRAGSQYYARTHAGAPILAVFQMDMIGYDQRDPRTFELHAGSSIADVQERTQVLTALMRDLAHEVSRQPLAPQLWPGGNHGEDPGERRSDHFSFHQYHIPACLISEDLFPGPEPNSPREKNPKWHLPDDREINPEYAADIARTVAAAAWVVATR